MPRYTLIALFLLLSLTACSYDSDKSATAPGTAPPPGAQQETIAPIPTAMDTFRALAPPDGLKFTPLFNQPAQNEDARLKRLEDAVQTIRNDVDTLVPTMVRMVAIEKDIKGLVAQLQTLTDGQAAPPPLTEDSSINDGNKIPREESAGGTDAPSSLVTPEAASKGELPPEGAASPNSGATAPQPIPGASSTVEIPREESARGTDASTSLVTPEAASEGELPPDGAASPNLKLPPQGLNLGRQGVPEAANQVAPAAPAVVNMRIADAADKTRLTLDVTAADNYKAQMSPDGKTLTVDLSRFNWGGSDTWQADHDRLISGGTMKNGKLYVNLKAASGFKTQKILPPSGGEENHRIVIDLFKKKTQKPSAAVKAKAAPKANKEPTKAKTPAPQAPVPAQPPADEVFP